MLERDQKRRELTEQARVYGGYVCDGCRHKFNDYYVSVLGEKFCAECLRDVIADRRPSCSLPGDGRDFAANLQYHGESEEFLDERNDSSEVERLSDEGDQYYD